MEETKEKTEWKEFQEELIIFLQENKDKMMGMPTPDAFDICNHMQTKFAVSKKSSDK